MRNRGINAAVRLWKVQRCCGRYSYISSQLYEQSSINPHSDSCQLTSIAACTQTQLLGHLMNSIANSYDDRDDALPQYCAVSSAFTTFGCRGAELDQLPTLQDNQMPQSLLSQSMKPYCCPHSGCSSRSYRIFPIFLSCTDHTNALGFVRSHNLDVHINSVHQAPRFTCQADGCPRTYVRKYDLKRHYERKHSGFQAPV